MRLSKIKLAGFKSFVDPTTIDFPSNLNGIVGPNGCGKSNTIDAVRWVMGESSAKHLRGASMEDVIFSGSSSRKPVSQASVELVFDNSEGKLEGPYANYAEISTKRMVTRDGQSKYFLNGTKCRRRDIADLFLGTGLGPRSYAIIEQGMISRLIEAKPEELRAFLEEAAGISKYKERRRETENRIRHTRENLERLADLREEVDKQLSHLQRQSRTAEKYKELKIEERRTRAEHLALRWQELHGEMESREQTIEEQETRLQEVIAEQRSVESELETLREQRVESNEALNAVQARFYSLGSEISRIEQTILHEKDLMGRQQNDLADLENALKEVAQALESDREQLEEIELILGEAEPKLEMQRESQQEINEQLSESEQAMQEWQAAWDQHNERAAEPSQVAQVERTRMEQLEKHVNQLRQRLEKVDDEKRKLVGDDLEVQLEQLREQSETSEMKKAELDDQVAEVIEKIRSHREQAIQFNRDEDDLRRQLHDTRGHLASLEALQKAALGKKENAVTGWLEKHGLADNTRLAENIEVEAGWEKAVETVLGSHLEAVCVEGIDSVAQVLGDFQKGHLNLLDTSANAGAETSADSLLSKITSSVSLAGLLDGVKVAADLNQALAMRSSLAENESVITSEGIWLASSWLRVARDEDEKSGVLAREHEIKELQQSLEELDMQAEELEVRIQDSRAQLQNLEQQREQWQAELNNAHSQCAQIQAQLTSGQSRLEQLLSRNQNLQEESVELTKNIERQQDEMELARRKRNEAMTQMEDLSREREELSGQRDNIQNQLHESRSKAQSERESVHELAIQIESRRSLKRNLEQNIDRMSRQLEQQQQRREELQQSMETVISGENKTQELALLLEERLQVEEQLTEARRSVESVDSQLRQLEQKRNEYEQKSQVIRSSLEQARLNTSEVRVRSQTVQEQLAETDFSVEELLEALGEDARIDVWARKVDEIAQRISRLGPINLAAIDEYQEQGKRKEYLDSQNNDVNEALETLEKAIAKIDKETRLRFKETFEHVNTRIQEMFPRLFGGGQAYLELTGDDLLDTGVVVMARPPGKRISHIQLMSGGEKALTAVALVFAIFELNPAPFCMLDEVDAPLDEANVGRFCSLVKTMSKSVQFIFITHHKVTMEMAEKMNGVTMREAGVSRLVSVDVEEAVKMVEMV
ncbi:Chromosome partition protein smc [hydrothermal vent metagenome]|uniref:Chromosome partition protein smc n=1 Tax=hydrothermal vent metagenome TaxID=652676 RepID=A0A3B0YG67_9ZZZZ